MEMNTGNGWLMSGAMNCPKCNREINIGASGPTTKDKANDNE
jgi:hypothetical protein